MDDSTSTVGLAMDTTIASVTATQPDWSWTFWFGETLAMMWSWHNASLVFNLICTIMSSLLSLWLRGRLWRYATLLGIELVIAFLLEFALPLMECISEIALENIVIQRMKKVGEKIRMHDEKIKLNFKRKKIRHRYYFGQDIEKSEKTL